MASIPLSHGLHRPISSHLRWTDPSSLEVPQAQQLNPRRPPTLSYLFQNISPSARNPQMSSLTTCTGSNRLATHENRNASTLHQAHGNEPALAPHCRVAGALMRKSQAACRGYTTSTLSRPIIHDQLAVYSAIARPEWYTECM